MDSLMIVELSNQIQAELGTGTQVSATLAFDYPRIVDLGGFLLDALAGGGSSTDASIAESTTDTAKRTNPGRSDLAEQVDQLSEDEALRELMQELDDNPAT